MKTPILFALALILSIGMLAQEADTLSKAAEKTIAVPTTIDFQGRLHDNGGSPVNATLSIKFSLYDVVSGGTALWTETRTVQVTDGLFQVKLGETSSLSPSHFSGTDRWLGIKVGAEAEMSPRTKISSVGYALQAIETDPTWEGGVNSVGSIGRTGFVGIGTLNPQTPLEVASTGIPHIRLTNNSAEGGFVQKITFWKNAAEKFAIGYDLWNEGDDLFTLFDTNGHGPVFNIKNGYVGINTTDPTQTLDVAGTIRLRGNLFDYNNASGTSGQVLTRTASGVLWQPALPLPYSASLSSPSLSVFTITNYATDGYSAIQGSASGTTTGVVGLAYLGTGVLGYSYAGKGVHGFVETGDSPIAIYGQNESIQGSPIGIKGTVITGSGFSGYFTGGKFYVGSNVGIGTTNPSYRLGIYAPSNSSTGLASFHSLAGTQMVQIRQSTGDAGPFGSIQVYNHSGTATIVTSGEGNSYFNAGNLGIGNTTPGYKLTVNGTAWCSAGAWTGSDIRWKRDITPLNRVLPQVMDLQAVNYFLRMEEFPEMGFPTDPQIGLIAQEVEKIFPQLVSTDPNGFKSIAYDKLSVLLLEAVKEQQAEIDELRQKEQQLKAENDQMNVRLERLERALESLSER